MTTSLNKSFWLIRRFSLTARCPLQTENTRWLLSEISICPTKPLLMTVASWPDHQISSAASQLISSGLDWPARSGRRRSFIWQPHRGCLHNLSRSP